MSVGSLVPKAWLILFECFLLLTQVCYHAYLLWLSFDCLGGLAKVTDQERRPAGQQELQRNHDAVSTWQSSRNLVELVKTAAPATTEQASDGTDHVAYWSHWHATPHHWSVFRVKLLTLRQFHWHWKHRIWNPPETAWLPWYPPARYSTHGKECRAGSRMGHFCQSIRDPEWMPAVNVSLCSSDRLDQRKDEGTTYSRHHGHNLMVLTLPMILFFSRTNAEQISFLASIPAVAGLNDQDDENTACQQLPNHTKRTAPWRGGYLDSFKK